MPTKLFNSALKKLDLARRKSVTAQLEAWANETPPSEATQIAENITRETALSSAIFTQLLSDFADALPRHTDPLIAWENACKIHHFATSPLAAIDRPVKLGRACKSDIFLKYAKTSDRIFKRMLTKYAGSKKPLSAFIKILKTEKLGGPMIFATFNDSDSTQDPFGGLPWDRDAIRTAFGLGQFDHASPSPYLLFRYHSAEPPSLTLHRPSIADAGRFSHFRPVNSAKAKCGFTRPLEPNLRKLSAKPELVHQQIIGDRLVFPYEITTP